MTYGDPLVEVVPAVGASGTGYATSINEAIEEMQTVLETGVPFSSLQGSELDLNNVPILDATYITLVEGIVTPAASPIGRLARYQNNLYWVTDEGAVRITLNGALDATSVGGIGGNYGGGNPALVSFSDANQRYEFYDDSGTSTWAYLRSRGLDIADGAATTDVIRLRAPAIAASYDLTLPAAVPVGGRAVLVMNTDGAVTPNDVNSVGVTLTLASGVNILLQGDGLLAQGNRIFYVGLNHVLTSTGAHTPNPGFVISGTAGVYYVAVHGWQENYRIKTITGKALKGDTATTQLDVEIWNDGSVSATVATATSTTSGTVTLTGTAGSPAVITSTDSLWIKVTAAANNDRLYALALTYDIENL